MVSLSKRVCWQIQAWDEKEVSELSYYASGNIQEWRDGDRKCSEECVLAAGGFRFVPLPLFTMGRTVENFLASCQNEKNVLQVIIENERGKEP